MTWQFYYRLETTQESLLPASLIHEITRLLLLLLLLFSRRQITHINTHTLSPSPLLFPADFIPAALIILIFVFGDFRHRFPTFSTHRLFSCFPAFLSIGRGCRLDPPLQTGSLRIRCSLPQVSLSKLTFSPLRASPSLPTHPVPVWMVENISTLPRR